MMKTINTMKTITPINQIRDLRIGNLIDFNGQIYEVAGLADNGVHFKIAIKEYFEWTVLENVQAIPLNNIWLEKLGFHIVTNEYKSQSDWYWCKGGFPGAIHNLNWEYLHGYCTVKFVHQLQNLHFALTGTDLCLKRE